MHILIRILLVLLIIMILYLVFIIPSFREKEVLRFCKRNYAHRGLHTISNSIPENSLRAFRRAVKYGYGIELDIQITKDEKLVVFHDFLLSRACDIDCHVWEKTYEELQELSLFGTRERIPLLTEVLEVVSGQVPLIVEIKLPSRNTRTCVLLNEIMSQYTGDYCIESFNPFAVIWYRKNCPGVVRGQLAANFFATDPDNSSFYNFIGKNMLLNFLSRPDFISFRYKDRHCLSFQLIRRLYSAPTFAWTVRNKKTYEEITGEFDSFIFEFFKPETHIN